MGLFHDIYNLTLVFSGVDWIFGVPYSYGPKYQIITGETTGYFYGIIRNVGCLIIPPYFFLGGLVSIPIVNSWNPIVSSSWNLPGYYTMPSGQGQNMSFLAILKVN